ncbi:MAG: glycosyltransferase family 1 protein [Planctomycetes bacterium]|nr:glycosyltransferase family 1 protein [Planctomycetota bacterium]
MPDARCLFFLNPGRTSRCYLLGMLNAAARLGIPHWAIELAPLWQRMAAAADKAAESAAIGAQLSAIVRERKITHAIGYGFNGSDQGALLTDDNRPTPLLPTLGVTHIMLWTDHPEWCVQGAALDEPRRSFLSNPRHIHLLKSASAAAEASALLAWPNLRAMHMAEDTHTIRPVATDPIHDVVTILADAAPPHEHCLTFLEADDPDPAAIDALMRPVALAAFNKTIRKHDPGDLLPALSALADAWLQSKAAAPLDSFFRASQHLSPNHAEALAWLRAQPRRWYGAVGALRQMVSWRRNFWTAWLARRVPVAVYGSDAACLGTLQPPGASEWVAYDQLPKVFGSGRLALTINAAHDEEGASHKAFQIAAAGVPCLHHASRGIDELFNNHQEIELFTRGPHLLDTIRSLLSSPTARTRLAQAARARAESSHDWSHRLIQLLSHS